MLRTSAPTYRTRRTKGNLPVLSLVRAASRRVARPVFFQPMRAFAVALAAMWLASAPLARNADTLRAADGWRSSLTASLAGSQAAYSNWQEGGLNALAVMASAEGTFDRVIRRTLTTQSVRTAFGLLRQDTLDVRKAPDLIRYDLSAELASDNPIRPAAAFGARTQFAPGYDYSSDADRYPSLPVVPGEAVKVSDVASPLVLTQSVGVADRPGGSIRARTGLTVQGTLVRIERLRPVYENDLGQPLRTEMGVDAEAVFEGPVLENVGLRSRLYVFQGFGQVGEEPPDALFDNTLALRVNRLLNVKVDAAVLYDADVSRDVQLKEVVAIGLTFDLL